MASQSEPTFSFHDRAGPQQNVRTSSSQPSKANSIFRRQAPEEVKGIDPIEAKKTEICIFSKLKIKDRKVSAQLLSEYCESPLLGIPKSMRCDAKCAVPLVVCSLRWSALSSLHFAPTSCSARSCLWCVARFHALPSFAISSVCLMCAFQSRGRLSDLLLSCAFLQSPLGSLFAWVKVSIPDAPKLALALMNSSSVVHIKYT